MSHAVAAAAAAISESSGLDLLVRSAGLDCCLNDSTSLYARCVELNNWKPLGETLEAQGYLFVRGALTDSLHHVQTVHTMMQQLVPKRRSHANSSNELVVHIQTCTAYRSFNQAHHVQAWKAGIAANSAALQGIISSDILQTLIRRVNFHTGGCSATMPGCSWLRAHAPGAAATSPYTDYLHFRTHQLDIFGSPFRPRWSTPVEEQCPQQHVSQLLCSACGRTHCRSQADEMLTAFCICSACACVCVLCGQDLQHHAQCSVCSDIPLDHYTCWIPLHDHDSSDSRLQILADSHLCKGYANRHSGDLLPAEAAAAQQTKQWLSADRINAGDVIIYNWRTVHRFTASKHKSRSSCSMDIRLKFNHITQDQIPAPPRSSFARS